MTLLTAHRILIGTAIVFFLGYGIWELRHFPAGGAWALVRGGASVAISLGFLVYYRSLGKS